MQGSLLHIMILFPQHKVSLSQQDKEEIIVEVMEKHQLAGAIEVVNTALGFLTVNTWNKNAYLCRYVHEVLKFDENVFTTKVSRPCFILQKHGEHNIM